MGTQLDLLAGASAGGFTRESLGATCDTDGVWWVRALSLWQPFASLVQAGLKPYETRLRETAIRGPFVVCSTKGVAPRKLYGDVMRRLEVAGIDAAPYARETAPRGVALAIVHLTSCRKMVEEDEPGAWVPRLTDDGEVRTVWELARKPVAIVPFPVWGRQGWFRVRYDLLKAA